MTENKNVVRYVVITSDFYWGKAETMEEALKNANVNHIYALNSKAKNPNKAVVYRVELDPVNSVFNEQSKAELRQSGVSLGDDYEDGDLIEPWVNDWGSRGTWGARTTEKVIELKIK